MKIAQIVCTFPPYRGGMGNSAYYFAKETAAAGHAVTVFTPAYRRKPDDKRRDSDEVVNCEVKRLRPLFQFGNAAFLPQLAWRLKNYDLIHLHYPFYGAMLQVLLAKLFFNRKMKLLLHYHMDSIGTGLKGLIFKLNRLLILPLLIKKADFISCASLDYVKNSALTGLYEKYRTKFITLPFGVDLNTFKPLPAEKNDSENIILFVATLDKAHYFKGLEVLLLSLKLIIEEKHLAETGIKLKLMVVGGGGLKNYYRELARNLGLADYVNFIGGLPAAELVKMYNRAKIFILPSINQGEAFGLVLLEAMACGTPVIASNLPGVRSVFHNTVEGFAVRPSDEKDLAKRIWQLLTDEPLRKKMGEAALKRAIEKYDWQKIGRDLVRFYYRANFTPKE